MAEREMPEQKTDYQGSSQKKVVRQPAEEKKIEKVVIGEVTVQRKSLFQKFKAVFVKEDIRSVRDHVIFDILIPATKNMVADASIGSIERMIYGDRVIRRRSYGSGPGPRVTYNSPVNRSYSSPLDPRYNAPPVESGPRRSAGRGDRDDDVLICTRREDAEAILEHMQEIIEQYEVASVADLKELAGRPFHHTDNKWGWNTVRGVQVRQIREGFLIDFPEPIAL